MGITLNHENGKLTIQNGFYTISFNTRVGGIINHLRNKEATKSLLTREGCEIWSPKWGGFASNHYQQERTGIPKIKINKEAGTIIVRVENQLGNSLRKTPRKGWCINNWTLKKDTPLIHCSAQIGDPDAKQAETVVPSPLDGRYDFPSLTLNMFKKYICFHPGDYKFWAYRDMEDEIVSGLLGWNNLTSHFRRNGVGYNIMLNRGKWITLFNNTRGVALIPLESDKTYEHLNLRFWQSKSMEELLYSCHSNEKNQSLSLGYLEYATTPQKTWSPVDDIYEGKGISTKT